jgi:peptidoglycan hydrolase-like protein with peptidoglycan-binding domain
MTDRAREVSELQTKLTELGFGPLTVDGQYGPKTEAAYRMYLDTVNPEMPSVAPAAEVPWYLSRAMIGALATIISALLGIAGWAVDSGQLANIITSLIALVGGVIAIVGTLNRKGRIDKTAVLPGIRYTDGNLIATDTSGWNQK